MPGAASNPYRRYSRLIGISLLDDAEYKDCLVLREALYSLTPQLSSYVTSCWYNLDIGLPDFCLRQCKGSIPADPSGLINVLCFSKWQNAQDAAEQELFESVKRFARPIRVLRNRWYGHIPELRIRDRDWSIYRQLWKFENLRNALP